MNEDFPEAVELGEKQTSPSAPGPGNMAALKRKYTIEEKRQILEMYDQLPRMSQRKAAKRLNITPSTLWTIIHNRACIAKGEVVVKREKKKWVHCGRSPRLEANIWKWIDQARFSGMPVTDLAIHRKSMEIAARMGILSFRPSPRWYSGFKKREPIVRERYRIYPEPVQDQLESHSAPCSSSPPADLRETSVHQSPKECAPVSDPDQDEELKMKS
ncbi:major centromere autoantigen B, partial [Clarias magur]